MKADNSVMTKTRRVLWESVLYVSGCIVAAITCGCGVVDPCNIPTTVILTVDRYQLSGVEGSQSEATLRAFVVEGQAPFEYGWSVEDPGGRHARELLDVTDGWQARFVAGDIDGPYTVTCTVVDNRGCAYSSDVVLTVGTSVGLDITADRYGVVAGGGELGQATIHLNQQGRPEPYDVTWVVVGPDGNIDDDRLTVLDPLAPVFESSDEVGVYILTATFVDGSGFESIESIVVVVGQELGLDVITERSSILPGGGENGTTTLLATAIGGKEPYSYDWEVIGPDGESANDLLWDSSVRSPVFESGDDSDGPYLIRCSVTDAEGTVLLGSVSVIVGQQLAVDLSADRLTLAQASGSSEEEAGTSAVLTASVLGGRQPVELVFSVIDPDGMDASDLLSSTTEEEVTFGGADVVGRYFVRVTATDADGVRAFDSLTLNVGGTLAVTVVAERAAVAATTTYQGQTTIAAQTVGGEPPFEYEWSVTNSAGVDWSSLLTSRSIAEPIFTGISIAGTYSIVCEVRDSAGEIAIDGLSLFVGQPLSVDVTVDRQALVAGGGVGGQAQLTTRVYGGVAPHQYQWLVLADDGSQQPNRLNSTSVANPIFASSTATGTYRLTLSVTDAMGTVFSDSVEVVVSSTGGGAEGQELSLDVSGSKQVLAVGGDTSSLDATVTGGLAPITYSWSVTDPSGTTDNSFVDSTTNQAVTFTSGTTLGTYRVRCTATDATGATFTDSVQINVTDAFLLNLSASISSGVPGSTVNLSADRTGGSANFTYAWSALNSSGAAAGSFGTGSTGVGTASHVAADDVTNAWTAPATGISSPETYRITCTATDSQGSSFSDTVHVVIEPASVLTVELVPNTVYLSPGGSVNLTGDQTGGVANFDFVWSAKDSSGTAKGAFTTGSTGAGAAAQNGQAGDVSNVWTAPAIASGTMDTYQITVTVSDALGDSVSDAVYVVVQSQLTLDVTASDVFVNPSTAVSLLADQSGGEPNFSYSWTAKNSSGTVAGSFTNGSTGVGAATQAGQAGDATNTWTAPALATGTLDTYEIRVTMTDNRGYSTTDSVFVIVHSQLSLDLTVNDTFVAPATAVNLVSDCTGGEPSYRYSWKAVNSAGTLSGNFTNGATAAGLALVTGAAGDSTNSWAVATSGTYTISCTVTDNTGQTFTDSVLVVVTAAGGFSFDITTEEVLIRPGESANLIGDVTGGTANYSYVWSAVNESGVAAGTLSATSQGNQLGDVANTWTAPTGAGVEGTYRIRCTATDSAGNTFTDSVFVAVSTQAIQNVFLAPAANSTASVYGGTVLNAFSTAGDPGQQVSAGFVNPPNPRNIVVLITDANNSITGGSARITGIDGRGQAQSEVIAIAGSAGGASTNVGTKPFATVTQLNVYGIVGLSGGDSVSLGVSNKFGLTGVISAATDVVYVNEGGTVLTSGYTVDATAGQQGITFSNSPNGARNYVVVFRAE